MVGRGGEWGTDWEGRGRGKGFNCVESCSPTSNTLFSFNTV